jgi:hypothetical protein
VGSGGRSERRDGCAGSRFVGKAGSRDFRADARRGSSSMTFMSTRRFGGAPHSRSPTERTALRMLTVDQSCSPEAGEKLGRNLGGGSGGGACAEAGILPAQLGLTRPALSRLGGQACTVTPNH